MRIAFAASEAVPFCKTGGLADVAGALSAELARKGHRVAVFVPYYRAARLALPSAAREEARLAVPIGSGSKEVVVRRCDHGPVEFRFIDCPEYFDREGLYQTDGLDHQDNAERFALFSRAVIESCRLWEEPPHILHCHDWQTGLVPALLRTSHQGDAFFDRTATVFTIHNLSYQGVFPAEALSLAGIPASEFTPDRLEYYGKVSYLKAGLVHADALNTVSPTYAREIQSPALGMGMDGVLRGRSGDLVGILNGIDVGAWDPATDKCLPRNYGSADFGTGKAACKRSLQESCGLTKDPRAPLIAAVSRLDHQKGLDLALAVLPERLTRGAQFVLIGQGDPKLEKAFSSFARGQPRAVHYRRGFDDAFARLVYAGCDIFLMPSRFEPCGLGQMIAMRYGSIPVGTETGGLADTIVERTGGKGSNGFLSPSADPEELAAALERAVQAYGAEPAWSVRVRCAMREDFSWLRAVDSYQRLYEGALQRRMHGSRA